MITCEGYEEHLSAYVDGELTDDSSAELFTHLGACPSCRRSFAAVSALRAHIASAPAPEVPLRLDRRIARLQPAAPARESRLRNGIRSLWLHRMTIPAPAFALALLLVTASILVSLLLIRTTPPPAGEQQVMYIMNMPAIEVEGVPNHSSSHVQ